LKWNTDQRFISYDVLILVARGGCKFRMSHKTLESEKKPPPGGAATADDQLLLGELDPRLRRGITNAGPREVI
jgi:hypothetical protein